VTRKPATERPDLAAHAARYLQWLADRAYSPSTIAGRRSRLRSFVAWCEERDICYPEELSRQLLEHYQRHLAHARTSKGQPLKVQTQENYLVAVRSFSRWLARQRLIDHDPGAELELPRLSSRVPRAVLTAAEAERVLNTPDISTPLGLRDRAILEVLYSTGLRRGELARLLTRDVDFERGTLLVRQGKGRKDRTVPIGERALSWLERYLADSRPYYRVPPDEGYLFLTRLGEPFVPNGVSELVSRIGAASGVDKPVTPHAFRHTAATVMLEGGADVRYIQQMLGHASLATTQVYTRVSITALKEVHNATHPGARHRPRVVKPSASDADAGPRIRLDEAE
jgi:integrase/recombinase XerD